MITLTNEKEKLTAAITGEIDHHSARSIREEIDANLKRSLPKELVFDFSGVTFMDSSGIGLLMGRYKLLCSMGGKIVVRQVRPQIARVLKLSGMNKLIRIEEEGEEENEDSE